MTALAVLLRGTQLSPQLRSGIQAAASTLVFLLLVVAAPAAVLATQLDSHEEEADGCDHGATGRECRDHVDNGKSCEEHGRHGGVNEDHCMLTTTTTSMPTPPTTSLPPVTTTSFPVVVATTSTTVPLSTVVETPALTVGPPGTPCVTSDNYLFVTSYPTCPELISLDNTTGQTSLANPTELPRTGSHTAALVGLGFVLILVGLAVRFA